MAQPNPNAPCHNRLPPPVCRPHGWVCACVSESEKDREPRVCSLAHRDWQVWVDSPLYWAGYRERAGARVWTADSKEPVIGLDGEVTWPRISPGERAALLCPGVLTQNVCGSFIFYFRCFSHNYDLKVFCEQLSQISLKHIIHFILPHFYVFHGSVWFFVTHPVSCSFHSPFILHSAVVLRP